MISLECYEEGNIGKHFIEIMCSDIGENIDWILRYRGKYIT